VNNPPSSLRDRILAAAATHPAATRKTHRLRRLLSMLVVLAILVGSSLQLAAYWSSTEPRPLPYVLTICVATVLVAILTAYFVLGPTPSAVGRSSRFHRLLTIAIPSILTLAALGANVLVPATLTEQIPPVAALISCSITSLIAGAGVLAALLILERQSVTTSAIVKGASFGAVAAAWAAVFISISCPHAHPLHVVPSHVLVPVVLLVLGGLVAGVRTLQMRAKRSSETN
jgi:hypothetical protein